MFSFAMFPKNWIFYLVVSSCGLIASNAEPFDERKEIYGTRYTVVFQDVSFNDPRYNENFTNACSGAIIDPGFVLTVASCVMNERYEFLSEVTDIVFLKTDLKEDIISIAKAYVPRTYNASSLHDDIAVLKLAEHLDMEKYELKALRLPSKTIGIGDNATMTTGLLVPVDIPPTNETHTFADIQLHYAKADIKIVRNAECRKTYPYEDVTLCARRGKTTKSAEIISDFLGDQFDYATRGSVSTIDDDTIVGVLSHESSLVTENGELQMYTDIYPHIDFIDKVINGPAHELDNITYISE